MRALHTQHMQKRSAGPSVTDRGLIHTHEIVPGRPIPERERTAEKKEKRIEPKRCYSDMGKRLKIEPNIVCKR